jgi:hypothetical protein
MKEDGKIDNYTKEEYEIFRALMIEEAWDILINKSTYIRSNNENTVSKIQHLEKMSDFFFVENELEISNEFNLLKKIIIIRHFLKDHILDI